MINFEICDRGEAEYEGSRFFGDPVVPEKWADKEPWPEDDIFMCQINLADLDGYDTEGLLPSEGYLYFFADLTDGIEVHPILSTQEPDTIYEDCNMGFEEDISDDIFTDWVIRFGKGKGSILERVDDRIVLLEFDPRHTQMDFLKDIGGKVRVTVPESEIKVGVIAGAVTEVI